MEENKKAYDLGRKATYINETLCDMANVALEESGIDVNQHTTHAFIQGYTAGMNEELAELKLRVKGWEKQIDKWVVDPLFSNAAQTNFFIELWDLRMCLDSISNDMMSVNMVFDDEEVQ